MRPFDTSTEPLASTEISTRPARGAALHFQSLTEVSGLIQRGALSPLELTRAMLARMDELDPRLHAFALPMAESALQDARRAEAEIAAGHHRGPLHGVPLAIKDIFWTAGAPTAAGMAIHRDFVAHEDATAVRRLKDAGAVILGKLTLTEGVYAEHRPPYAQPTNPWQASLWSGASSSGSAVAVAAGLCFGALASETGGSIKLPSAANGVTGIKPSWGRVSRHGVFELAASLDHVGAMARSAADAALILGAIAGADPCDPTSAPGPAPDYRAALERGVRGLRIGIDPAWTRHEVDPATALALEAAVEVLVGEGALAQSVRLPDGSDMIWDWFGVCAVETALAHEATYPARAAEYGPALDSLLKTGHAMTGMEHQRLLRRRDAFARALDAVLERVDVIALPVLSFQVPTLERMARVDDDLIAGLHRFTCAFNMSGHPGIVLPCGSGPARAPIVFQLVGRRFAEDQLFAAAHAFQRVTGWHQVRPMD
ncbi:amidase [Variovorax sp.]|jgi:amidase|uniref:amidase n=1 Tax=Variovorax sp. TaxID=1871043 RepID=UPI004037B56C